MDKLSFGQFNAAFKPARTGYDWLSRDPAEVDKYVADPWCGQISSAGLFGDLLGGLAWVNDEKNLGRVPTTLPVYLFSGDEPGRGHRRRHRLGIAGHLLLSATSFLVAPLTEVVGMPRRGGRSPGPHAPQGMALLVMRRTVRPGML